MTMSSSSAPSATANRASNALISGRWAPDGNPITVPTPTLPAAATAAATRLGDTHTVAVPRASASSHNATTWASVASGLSRV